MTESLKEQRKRPAPDSQQSETAAGTPPAPGKHLPAMPGLAVAGAGSGPGFDFVGKGVFSEPFNFEADVVQAIDRSKKLPGDILKAKQAISGLTTEALRVKGLKELGQIEKFVTTWDGVKVPLNKRKEIVDGVDKMSARLATIASEYAELDAAESKRIRDESRKAKKEQERRKKEEQRAAEDAAQAARQAKEKADAAASKIATDRSTLGGRGVLPTAEAVATAAAHRETADAEKELKADYAKAARRPRDKVAAHKELTAGLASLEAQRTESVNKSLGALAGFTNSAAARSLAEKDLAWVIQTAGVDQRRARSLAEVIKASGTDRTVAQGLAGLTGEDLGTTAQHCIALFGKGVEPASVLAGARAMAKSPEASAYLSSVGAKLVPGYLALADVDAPKELKETLAFDLQTPGTPYTPAVARRLAVGLAKKEAPRTAINWLIDCNATPEFAALVDMFVNPAVEVAVLVGVFKAGAKVYKAHELLGLCQRHIAHLADLATEVATGQPGCPGYTDLVMQKRNSPGFQDVRQSVALRAAALLASKPAKVSVTIGQQPVDFGRTEGSAYRAENAANDAKTGFVGLTFRDLPGYYEIHTHWAQKKATSQDDGRIYSMHVKHQDRNGMELHTDQVFRPLVDKVVTLHNDHYPEPEGGAFYA